MEELAELIKKDLLVLDDLNFITDESDMLEILSFDKLHKLFDLFIDIGRNSKVERKILRDIVIKSIDNYITNIGYFTKKENNKKNNNKRSQNKAKIITNKHKNKHTG